MTPIRSLLIADDAPNSGYGTGQRLLSMQRALEKLGECRFLWLAPDASQKPPEVARYTAPSGLPSRPSRIDWIRRQLTFAELRPNAAALAKVDEVWKEFPFDVAVCSFFRSTGAAPLHRAPCLLDVDCMPMPSGKLTRALWPATRLALNWRASSFRKVFVIRAGDTRILDRVETTLLPCIAATAGPPLEVEPDAVNVLFVGSVKWGPNRESAEYLVHEVQPKLAAQGAGFRVRLVGGGTEVYDGVNGVSAGGFVDDLRSEYRRATVVVCPVWAGAGANVKLAEALQFGSAVVASANAALGFEGVMVPGQHGLVGEDRESFARLLLGLLADPARRAELRRNATELGHAVLTEAHFGDIVGRAVREAIRRQ